MGQLAGEPEGSDEQALLTRARQGDTDALESLLERYEPQLYRFSMRMCGHPEDAREVLQESLLAAARGLGDFRGDSALSSWLYAITRSFCTKKRRRRVAEPSEHTSLEQASEALAVPDSAPAPDQAAADREIGRALERAIASLDAGQREVLLLRDVEGLSAAETAAALAMSVPQVKSRLHRARIAVRRQVAPVLAGIVPPEGAPGVDCPDIALLFSQNLEGEISPELCARMQDHVDACGHCRSTCDSLKRTLAVCRAVPAPHVPEDIQDAVRSAIRRGLAAGSRTKA